MVDLSPVTTIERPAMVTSLSPSSMATWRQCPKRFFFEKILRIETETGEPAVCGTFIHRVLEHLMTRPPAERTVEQARVIAGALWPDFTVDPESRFAELDLGEDEARAFKRRAWAGIAGYFSIEDPAAVDVVGTEQEVQASLGGAPVYGIIDRVDRAPDGLVVTDYKSGKAPKWDDEREEKLGQLRTYAALLAATGQRVSRLRLLFVSPQIAAAAKAERCEAAAGLALGRLLDAVPEVADQVAGALADVDDARRAAREAAPDALAARVESELAGAAAASAAAEGLVGQPAPEVAALIEEAVATRRKAFFAHRAARTSRPTTVALEVRDEDLEMARAEAATIWEEANGCYEAWDFPGHTGPLCDWCPFAARCETFSAWEAAGRPS
jgi:putative RecB family exonuclease